MKQEFFYMPSWDSYCEKILQLIKDGYWIDISFFDHLDAGIIIAHKQKDE
jgi:hypothetical protein